MIAAITFGLRKAAGSDGHPLIVSFVDDHLDPGTGRIKATVLRRGVKCSAGFLAGATPVAFAQVHYYFFDYFFWGRLAHCSYHLPDYLFLIL
jgi:hypothetical protein